ncbi:MAG: hypothetical protein V3T35_10855 [Spirochaetia bacterium]|jgi:hypothetical protein
MTGEEMAEVFLYVFNKSGGKGVHQGDDQNAEGDGSTEEEASFFLSAEVAKTDA